MSTSAELGAEHEATLSSARVHYRERGEGPPLVFVHGLLVNGDLWREVVPGVAGAGFRCITPDWPLGAHAVPAPEADLTVPGVARLIGEFLDTLGLDDVTLVANDTGGALTQLLITSTPERVGRVVLTNCDCFERFLPPVFSYLPLVARSRLITWMLIQSLRIKLLHRLPIAFGWLTKRPLPSAVTEQYLRPSRQNPAIRRDLTRFLRSIDKRHTLAAAKKLPGFNQPVLLAWATEDKVFPVSLAHRLEKVLPHATFAGIDDSYTFVPEDQPKALTDAIIAFARTNAQT